MSRKKPSGFSGLVDSINSIKEPGDENLEVKPPKQRKRGRPKKLVEPPGPQRNVSIRVPKTWSNHWHIEARKIDKTMKDVIVELLTRKFGVPEE